jgi:hypothetical protein
MSPHPTRVHRAFAPTSYHHAGCSVPSSIRADDVESHSSKWINYFEVFNLYLWLAMFWKGGGE